MLVQMFLKTQYRSNASMDWIKPAASLCGFYLTKTSVMVDAMCHLDWPWAPRLNVISERDGEGVSG